MMARTGGPILRIGAVAQQTLEGLGDVSLFSLHTFAGLFRQRLRHLNLVAIFYQVGVLSVPVVAVTGIFIGMVLAVQSYGSYHRLGLASQLGMMINVSVIRELGPVLAATMLAGRVGSAMAAELATMKVTEQIDALACLGVDPVHYLAVPRLLACVLLVPLLTVLADCAGVLGGALITLDYFQVEAHFYWQHSRAAIGAWDISCSLIKPLFFGTAIGLISCHRGFKSRAGAEGVGRAATEAFVSSFLAILVLDFFLALFLDSLYEYLWPAAGLKLM